MSRITTIKIGGKEYPLNFSMSAFCYVEDHLGGIDELSKEINGDPVKLVAPRLVPLAEEMMKQGYRYQQLMGELKDGSPLPLSVNEIETLISPSDYSYFVTAIAQGINAGMNREVEVKTGKNAKAVPEKQ